MPPHLVVIQVRNRYLYLVDKQKERRASLGEGQGHDGQSATSYATADAAVGTAGANVVSSAQ
jgi:hypothetical protein